MQSTLITGASSGIGAEMASIFASHKHNLILCARSQQKLEELAINLEQKYKVIVKIFVTDLSQEEDVERLFDYCQANAFQVDYLVNNAGFGDGGDFIHGEWHRYRQMIDLNIKALTHLSHLFIPVMVNRGFGKVLNVASIAGFMPGPGMNVYFASKAYVLHFSEALNVELKGSGVIVTVLCPGPTRTAFFDVAKMQNARLVATGLDSVEKVAKYGFIAMMKNKRVAIPGWKNKIMALSSRWSPRSLVMKIAQSLNKKGKS